MTQPRPTTAELVDAVRRLLHDELLPALEGRPKFQTRVAVNVLDIVRRELADGDAADAAEVARLRALLGQGDEGDVETLSRHLAQRIRDGEIELADPDLLEHLRLTATADVAIANPRHASTPSDGAPS